MEEDLLRRAADLAERRGAFSGAQERRRVRGRERDAALIDHAGILFLDLGKDPIAVLRYAVAAHAQLFFIDRLFERRADEPPVVRVIIEVADRVALVHITLDMGRDACEQSRLLRRREKVLLFVARKAVLHGIGHIGGPLSALSIPPPPKENLKKISVFPLGCL